MDDVSQVLVGALKDVQEAKVPEDLREIAFKEAIRLREAATGAGATGGPARGSRGGPESERNDGAPLGQIASLFGTDQSLVNEVFNVRDGEVRLAIGSRSLAAGKRPATREIAVLVAGARQATGQEEWTSVNAIREWCEEYDKYDRANFAKSIAAMDDLFQFAGKGQKREVRMRQPAWEEAGDLVRRLGGGE